MKASERFKFFSEIDGRMRALGFFYEDRKPAEKTRRPPADE